MSCLCHVLSCCGYVNYWGIIAKGIKDLHKFRDLAIWVCQQSMIRSTFDHNSPTDEREGIKMPNKGNTIGDQNTGFCG